MEFYDDDMAVHSLQWPLHLRNIDDDLRTIRASGITLNFEKCEFGKPVVRYVGYLIGSGHRSPDPLKDEVTMK